LDDTSLDSDVTTWRYAWKLHVSTKSDKETIQEDEMVTVTVVDTDDNNVNYYITGAPEIYNIKNR